jgi:hypothetical protein
MNGYASLTHHQLCFTVCKKQHIICRFAVAVRKILQMERCLQICKMADDVSGREAIA